MMCGTRHDGHPKAYYGVIRLVYEDKADKVGNSDKNKIVKARKGKTKTADKARQTSGPGSQEKGEGR